MRLLWSLSAIAVTASSVAAFAPVAQTSAIARGSSALNQAVAAADVKAKQDAALEKLKAKDASSSAISKDVSYSRLINRRGRGRRILVSGTRE